MNKVNPKVSIVIPTYNRAHLIGETLDTILAQTYQHWECLIVDDGSTDHSQTVFEEYGNKDARFKFFNRPATRPKGANACRNIGLDNAQGEYIVFFDSDDLMTPDHLEVKVGAIEEHQTDYVITRTKYFNHTNAYIDEYYKNYERYDITAYNYVSKKINWLTLDIIIKRKIVKNLRFNEKLQANQEYNFYCKLVHVSTNAIYIDKVVSLRRHHDNSIRTNLKDRASRHEGYFRAFWFTYLDIKEQADKPTRRFLLGKAIRFVFNNQNFYNQSPLQFYKVLFNEFGLKTIYAFMFINMNKHTGKGHYFRDKFLKNT